MKQLLTDVTADVVGPLESIVEGRTYCVGIAADANLGGGTLTLKVVDRDTNTELATDPAKYEFTAVFEPFEITLAPGMGVQMELAGATAPDISGVFMYKSED